MSDAHIWVIIAGMAVSNFVIRYPPIAVLSRLELPGWLTRWLSFVPVSVMATLVVSAVARPDGVWRIDIASPYLWAAVFTGLVYWRSRSFLGATAAGIVSFLALRSVLG
jgi:branched-subunit amino acid transport protein